VALVSKAGPVVPDLWFGAAVAACLAATLCYAASSIYMKKHAVGAKPLAIAGWSQVFAGLVLLPVVPFAPASGAITPLVVANVLGLALICSSIAYVLYYRLIADVGPTRALTVAFLMPAFGMVWGALFLDETITWPMIAGCALIIGGTGAVLRPGGQRRPRGAS
jgi:drug/metabolite transporter (DMT)-like permease